MNSIANMSIKDLGRVLVIVPTYNEIDNVRIIVQNIREVVPEVDVLIADDNSPDGTGLVADQIAQTDPKVQVLHRVQKAGLGAAYLAAFEYAKAQNYDVVVEMDADGSHRAIDLRLILTALNDADVVLGSRWIKGGQVKNWPKRREILSRGGNIYTRIMLGIPIKDSTGGFRAYRVAALEKLDTENVESQGYCFQVDMAWRSVQAGLKVTEVPITFIEREIGESKMSGDIVKEALLNVTLWGFEKRLNQLGALLKLEKFRQQKS
jgi:dolichol-phosphate mannosyltransferase